MSADTSTAHGTSEAAETNRGAAAKPDTEMPAHPQTRRGPFLVQLYRSALGKKYVMAITGIIGMGYVFAHMIGNLKVYLGPDAIDHYGEWLRTGLLVPIVPETYTLWIMRLVLIAALVLHVHAAYALTVMNRKARPEPYASRRDYVAADFASRTMRWTGVIVLLFLAYHLADFTWGTVNPGFERGQVYRNLVASFSQPAVAALYIVANIALGVHLYHGVWSLFQSLGVNGRRIAGARRGFAVAFTALIVLGNVSFPVAVLTGIVS